MTSTENLSQNSFIIWNGYNYKMANANICLQAWHIHRHLIVVRSQYSFITNFNVLDAKFIIIDHQKRCGVRGEWAREIPRGAAPAKRYVDMCVVVLIIRKPDGTTPKITKSQDALLLVRLVLKKACSPSYIRSFIHFWNSISQIISMHQSLQHGRWWVQWQTTNLYYMNNWYRYSPIPWDTIKTAFW